MLFDCRFIDCAECHFVLNQAGAMVSRLSTPLESHQLPVLSLFKMIFLQLFRLRMFRTYNLSAAFVSEVHYIISHQLRQEIS